MPGIAARAVKARRDASSATSMVRARVDDGAQEGVRLDRPRERSVHQEISSRVAVLSPRHSTRA